MLLSLLENTLNKNADEILQYLYDHTNNKKFVFPGELETEFGLSPVKVRNCLEDLKEAILIFESNNGIQISEIGNNYAKTRWV